MRLLCLLLLLAPPSPLPPLRSLTFTHAAARASGLVGSEGDAALGAGRRIYVDGLLPSGEPVVGSVRGDVSMPGALGACVSCHRPSGLGTIEGGTITPPITGDILYRAVSRGRPEMRMARTVGANVRSAYTDTLLLRALREGINPDGRPFDATMPRYELAEGDATALIAYLKTLSSAASPGAGDTTIRFATIVAGKVPEGRRHAFLDVMHTFLRERNAGTRYEARRRTRPPMDMAAEYSRYRDWTLDVWTLEGAPSTWRVQLAAAYQRAPVFAVLSGVTEGAWAPVHEFCEAARLPCLFPVTDLPPQDAEGGYTMYFSRGVALEAAVLAAHLSRESSRVPIVQIFREGGTGAVASAALSRALSAAAPAPAAPVTPVPVDAEGATPAFWRRVVAAHPDATIVAWLDEADLGALGALAHLAQGPRHIYLSSSLAPVGAGVVPSPLRQRTRLVHPYERPEDADRRLQRTRAWLRTRRIAISTEERVQAGAFYALSVVTEALAHNFGFFVREFLVEQIEGMASAMPIAATYPRLSLGPGQRFASKGGYILQLNADPALPPVTVSDWIVP